MTTKHTDIDGNPFELVVWPHPYVKGDRAGYGCIAKVCGGRVCKTLPNCTPKDANGNNIMKGHTVWVPADRKKIYIANMEVCR